MTLEELSGRVISLERQNRNLKTIAVILLSFAASGIFMAQLPGEQAKPEPLPKEQAKEEAKPDPLLKEQSKGETPVPEATKEIRAQKIVIVDDKGKMFAEIGVDSWDDPRKWSKRPGHKGAAMHFFDQDGKPRVVIGITEQSNGIFLKGKGGSVGASLSCESVSGNLYLLRN